MIAYSTPVDNNISGDLAGGIYNYFASGTFVNCVFRNNIAKNGGGALYNASSGSRGPAPTLHVYNCIFSDNSAEGRPYGKGGAIYNSDSDIIISNCNFLRNHTNSVQGLYHSTKGGAIYNQGGLSIKYESELRNCIFWDNLSFNGENVYLGGDVDIWNISNCNLQGSQESVVIEGNSIINWGNNNNQYYPLLTPDGHLQSFSSCINVIDSNSIALDIADLDDDGITNEITPFDLFCQEIIIVA